MRTLEVRLWGARQTTVGTLAEEGRGIYFEYTPAFLADPLPISPFKLPVKPGLFDHADREFGPVFGVFDDSLPDSWGRLLMDRAFRKPGRSLAGISVLDRLAYIGTRGMGALAYHPPTPDPDSGPLEVDLATLAAEAERVLEGSADDVLPALRIAGGSPGGARPKVLVGVRDDGRMIAGTSELPEGYRHFLVKFSAGEDGPHLGAVEAAYARMAAEAGLNVPPTRLFETEDGGRYFAAERFDRRGNARLHMHSLGGLWHASHRVASMDYEGFLRTTFVLTRDHRALEEAYRRMAFNVVAHNRDDHVKNTSFLMGTDGKWTLAPAYDLTFSEGPGRQHTMDVAGEAARPGDRDMLRVAERCEVDARKARAIIERVRDVVRQWPRFAAETGVPAETAQQIRQLLAQRVG
ncbi:type II toxin-antitoxin system HipA family toxin [Longimicrobium sp.]|uniref:type II toxin-antitoxin system HipA family toxin n=1 Tax=Longimicrobium sp. TaxID=2029185 RepID=UPI002D005D88|nr:type II toxin-antitoxin system HipA family toxin [Longimicrobium sp.]HSU17217.1 type II toxin-antitoxin system HipA family toxin [Longimicrobium sp.]